MQNLAIACALVCLILLGAAIVVGLFGVLRPQISAVLVTGVIYVLSATFATFTLTIVHFKHKNRDECDPLDVWTRLIPELVDNNDFRSARIISHGWSLQLAWAGTIVCVLASIMWILLSKMMRYNPISLTIWPQQQDLGFQMYYLKQQQRKHQLQQEALAQQQLQQEEIESLTASNA